MNRFSKVIHESLKNTNLKMVRIKVDPAQCTDDLNSIALADSYEGYILEDDVNGTATIYINDFPEDSNIVSLEPEQYIELPPLEEIKDEAILYLLQKGLINTTNHDEIGEILNVQSIRDLEIELRQYNITDSELLSLYRDYFKNDEMQCGSCEEEHLFEGNENIQRVGVFPGKFKIPHVGHFITALKAAEECDEVHIIISPKPQTIRIDSTKPPSNRKEPPDIKRYERLLPPPWGLNEPSENKFTNNLADVRPAEVTRPEGAGSCKGQQLSARYIRKALGENDLSTVKKNLPIGVDFSSISAVFDDIYEQQEITAEHAATIWELYIPILASKANIDANNISISISEISPVVDAYELVKDINETERAGDTQILLYVGKCSEEEK